MNIHLLYILYWKVKLVYLLIEVNTFDDLKMVGSAFILLGMVSYFDPTLSIYTWGLGFGVLHIIYGLQIYFQRERKRA